MGNTDERKKQIEQLLARNIYHNMFTLLKEEGRLIDALDKLLYVLYLDIHSEFERELRFYKNGWISKKELFETLETATFVAPGLVAEIGNLEEVFSLELIDRIYERGTGAQYCPKSLFVELISSIIDGEYDDAGFRAKLIKEFIKVTKL